MKWITREFVKVERVACPWLIKKFVDHNAEFIFVSRDIVLSEAKKIDAIPLGVDIDYYNPQFKISESSGFISCGVAFSSFINSPAFSVLSKIF